MDLLAAVVEEAPERDPALAAIGDRLGYLGLRLKATRCTVERLAQFVDQRFGAVLSASSSDIRLLAANLCLDLMELTDTLQQIGGEWRRLGGVDVDDLRRNAPRRRLR